MSTPKPHKLDPKKIKRLLVPGDLHFPTNDETATKLMVDFAEKNKIKGVVLQGDTHDVWGLSKYEPTDPIRLFESGRLADETKSSEWFMKWCNEQDVCFYVPGNHEARIPKFQARIPALTGIAWEVFLNLGRWSNIKVTNFGDWIRYGDLTITHGDRLQGSLSVGGARTVLNNYPNQSTLYGHTHRIQAAYRTDYNAQGIPTVRGAWSCGHMVDESKQDYIHYPNWQKGFAVVDTVIHEGNTYFKVHLVEVHRTKKNKPFFLCPFTGKPYTLK